jgi:hypothetical protein
MYYVSILTSWILLTLKSWDEISLRGRAVTFYVANHRGISDYELMKP